MSDDNPTDADTDADADDLIEAPETDDDRVESPTTVTAAAPPSPATGGPRRWWDRGLVWLIVIVVGVAGALGVGWWVERDTFDTSKPPTDGSQFCNTVAELQAGGDITVAMGQGAGGLQEVSDGLGRLQEAGVPNQIDDDLRALRGALDPVIREALTSDPADPQAINRLVVLLDDRTRELQLQSDRLNDYTKRWCGVDLNGTQEPDEGPAPAIGPQPPVVQPPLLPPAAPSG